MGSVQRKTNKYLELYRKKFRKKVRTVLSFTPPGIKKNDFIKLFSEIYPDDIISMEKNVRFYQEKNRRRRRGKPLFFPNPSDLLYSLAKPKLNDICEREFDLFQAQMAKEEALAEAQLDSNRKKIQYRNNNISTQFVTPKYISLLIEKYWHEKNKFRRLLIVIECSKYKNESTIFFFRQVMSGEKDWFIRNYCLRILQRFDEVVYLPPKGKGAQEKYNTLVKHFGCDYKEDIGRTPEDIVKELYENDYIEHAKYFDAFISHAVSNADMVDEFVFKLNSLGLVAFVDWKSDRQDLNRSKLSHYTPTILELRMRQSKNLILIRTKESDLSSWVTWEINYFSKLGKKIAVLNLDNEHGKSHELIDTYPTVQIIDGNILVFNKSKQHKLVDWINES
ncbi:TIR domain-containing protein [Shewanella sp. SM72]|uniref:TIR domain-containing protein n=1 Tax=Shewanella sp. SM72 TaxID=2912805 RepID=UPI0021DA48CF|nr:TIR domain-containing protein [Shewanella sp. SM72]MCU8018120.1 TIR domain-containing protein [Shewanella sp. SM72]